MSPVMLSSEGPIWTLTIHRPESLNALNSAVLNDLAEALDKINSMFPQESRALIITGSGEKAFVAGADIKEIAALDEKKALEFAKLGQRVLQRISTMKVPVVAAVNGFALGGGCELALACDYIYASQNAKFGLPEVSLGLIPGFGGTVNLARAVGLRRAREITFTGRMLTADEALTLGLVNRVVPLSELLPATRQSLESVLDKAPLAVAAAKKSINRAWDLEAERAHESEAESFAVLFSTRDVKEGTSAFIEKRKARFTGE